MKSVSKPVTAVLGAAIGFAPFTGGLSFAVAWPIAILTGLEIALIIAVFFIGLALVLLIVQNYKRVKFHAKDGNREAEIVLERDEATAPTKEPAKEPA